MVALTSESSHFDPDGSLTRRYRLFGVNGLGEDLLLGETSAKVGIYDVGGRLVRELTRGRFAPGPQRTAWDGRDTQGRDVAAGVYFVRVATGGFSASRKLAVVR